MTTDFTAEMLPRLTPRQRQMVRARLEGLSPRETAARFRLSALTVKMALRAARRRLGLPDGRTVAQTRPRAEMIYADFRPEHLELLGPGGKRAVALAMEGKTASQIAAKLGASRGAIYSRLEHARRTIEAAKNQPRVVRVTVEHLVPVEPRCRCGLRLPCNDCVGHATDYMWSGRSNGAYEGERWRSR